MDLGKKMRLGQQNDPRILVDPEDAWLLEYKWYIHNNGDGNLYAARNVHQDGKKTIIRLHRIIMGHPSLQVDHINGDGLDNQRSNLRLATNAENQFNRGASRSSASGFKGVVWHARPRLWNARIKLNGKQRSLGYFQVASDAARAYDREAIRVFGERARTNEVLGLYPQEVSA